MKFKYFLRGVGVGMVITAILLGISYKTKMSDEAVIAEAKKLGMIFGEMAEASSSPKVTGVPEASDVPEETVEPEASDVPEETNVPEETLVTNQPEVSSKPSKKYSLVINSGDSSRIVSNRLEEIGVIENSEEFDNYLIKNGFAGKLVVGKFYIGKNDSYEEIAEAITE